MTQAFGAVSGRVTGIAVDPADPSGNTVFVGTTGGGVWKSTNAAGPASQATFLPLTDQVPSVSISGVGSLSIGAVTVQPGNTGVVLAGTGDPNDALDSYYGEGILRSTDHGATWSTIPQSSDNLYSAAQPHAFAGEGFAGFAWSTVNPQLVVAAVTQALDGVIVNATVSNSVEGLYYSEDAGATWQLATITDGPGQIVQSADSSFTGYDGNAVTAVLWNPIRQQFFAAVRYHGYYSSPDGVTWTRLGNQPGSNLSQQQCPTEPDLPGNTGCPMFRGALAVQPVTGDLFAFSVDRNNLDQGIWRDVCAAAYGVCSTGTNVTFGQQLADGALEASDGSIPQGDYSLWLAALPAGADTLLYAGTEDIFKCSLAEGCPWRNTTNVNTCAAAGVAPSQHAVAASGPLIFFGNDSGLWRTTDGIGQQQPPCSGDDAAHFQNLNNGLGSLAEVSTLAQAAGSSAIVTAAEGASGIAALTQAQPQWPQVLDGWGQGVAIDPSNAQNWYASSGPGVSISYCGQGSGCDPAAFALKPIIGDAQTGGDGQTLINPAVWMLDPQDPSRMLVGTCRLWRGSVAGGVANWASSNAISPMLDGDEAPQCAGNAQIRSIGASGTIASFASGAGTTQEVLYAGMDGSLTGGGFAAGHVYTADAAASLSGVANWTDLYASPVVNDFSNQGQFNPGGFAVSSVVADTHDASGETVYTTIQAFSSAGVSVPHVYRSTAQGQSWTNITANLPDVPVNGLVVDPDDANIVYVATDAGVYVTTAVLTCGSGEGECWSVFGAGLPDSPVTAIAAWGSGSTGLLRAATYGRGIWQLPLASASSGTGVSPTTASLSPPALTFVSQAEGTLSASQTIIVTNTGSGTLTITSLQLTGDFTEQDTCATPIPPGGTCSVSVSFIPAGVGSRQGTLTLFANLATGQITAQLSGTGSAPGQTVLTPVSLTFPPTALDAISPVQYITVSNTGGADATLQSPLISGSYNISANTCGTSLPAATGCTVGIVFAPTASGAAGGIFSIATAAGTLSAQLNGTGVAPPTDTLSATALSFAPQFIGTSSAAQQVVLRNTGDAALTLIQVVSSSADFIANAAGCLTAVPGHQSCAISVTFAPTAPGARTGMLSISDALHNGTNAQTVALSGSGLAPNSVASVGPASLDFGEQGVGTSSAMQSVTITNNSTNALGNLRLVVTGDFHADANANGGTCGSSLPSGANCVAAVTFQPTVTGPETGTLTVAFTMLGQAETLVTTLSGTGLDFSMNLASTASQTIVTGATATYKLSLTPVADPVGGVLPAGSATLACTGAPAGSTCVANPATVILSSGASSTATVTVVTPALAKAVEPMPRISQSDVSIAMACALPLFVFIRRPRRSKKIPPWHGWLVVTIALWMVAGCGLTTSGGSKSSVTTSGTVAGTNYTLTVTASAPGIQKTVSMTLIVEQ